MRNLVVEGAAAAVTVTAGAGADLIAVVTACATKVVLEGGAVTAKRSSISMNASE